MRLPRRKILSWRLSSTMESEFCVEALRDAIRSTGRRPEIFNTEQGAQFTSELWLDALRSEGISISMNGKGRWIDVTVQGDSKGFTDRGRVRT